MIDREPKIDRHADQFGLLAVAPVVVRVLTLATVAPAAQPPGTAVP